MTSNPDPLSLGPADDPRWQARLRYWRRRLGRVRLGVEPVADQLARYRRVTWMLTALALSLSTFFLALFTAFGRPDVGAVLAAILFGPLILFAWADDALLRRKVSLYLRELRTFAHEKSV